MNLSIPIHVLERKPANAPEHVFTVTPLLAPRPTRSGEHLNRAITRLAQDLRRHLDGLAGELRQESLADWTFNPPVEEHSITARIELRRQTAEIKLLAISFEAMDRRIGMFPRIRGLWFDVMRGQPVSTRAAEVLQEHFRRQEKEDEEYRIPPELIEFSREWITSIEMDVHPAPRLEPKEDIRFILLGGQSTPDGRRELEQVGRCLDWLYPDELDRVILREQEVEELKKRLDDRERRPILLLGPAQSGKTAIIHETVYRRVEARQKPHVLRGNTWLIAPQRLIAGMSYVGQWENRLLAILAYAKKHHHVLYFDDVLGLYHAGVSASSDLAAAHVLRPAIERGDVRILAEMTPQAFGVLQERDRAMADLFHVIPVRPMNRVQTRSVMIHVARQIESQHRCEFLLDAIPTVLDLQERYVRELSLPGKAAAFLRQLAVKHRKGVIGRSRVLNEFGDRSGLSVDFLDNETRLPRASILEGLRRRMVGQDAAVETVADAVCIAKAHLNDPTRPLASLLFLGPTGVGKTECAKALARYLFGDADAMVRFDMNEYVDPSSVSRLVGTFFEPEGLLTSAVRRRPFCVLLLDEIEKADAGVFDLLLQVLGEGRLTDARGRTVDFTNAIVIMTSNLGTREAQSSFGLRPADRSDADIYRSAAERFFRPEFFNRIDRIVPFEGLSRQQVATIARRLIGDVFAREGLVHRRCVLEVDPAAMEQIIQAGYHPQLGARAMKRSIERRLTQPVAARLATLAPGSPALVSVLSGREGIEVQVAELVHAAPDPRRPMLPLDDPDVLLDAAEAAIDRIEQSTADDAPDGPLTQGTLSGEQFRYLAIREQAGVVRRLIQHLDRALDKAGKMKRHARPPVRPARHRKLYRVRAGNVIFRELLAAEDLRVHLTQLLEESIVEGEDVAASLLSLIDETALLHALADDVNPGTDRVAMLIRSISAEPDFWQQLLASYYRDAFARQYGATVQFLTEGKDIPGLDPAFDLVVADMPRAQRVFAAESGTHLLVPEHGNVEPAQVIVVPVKAGEDPIAAANACLAKGRPSWGSVVRVYGADASTTDLRSGMIVAKYPEPADFRRLVLSALPLPDELLEVDG